MALAGELIKYVGGELAKNTGKELATNVATSALSGLAPKMATKAGVNMANRIGNEMVAGSTLDKLIPKTRMLDKAGKPVTLYHSTPNNFDKFDDAMLGSNTGYDNTALGHFVTPDKDFSKRFIDIDNVGKTGRTMELQGNIQKPITHPYMAGYKYDNKDLDKIVEDYLLATDNPEFLDELRGYALDDNSNLYDEYMGLTMADSPFEVSGSDRQSLMGKGYDAVEIVEGPKSGLVEGSKSNAPVSSYAVFNGENLRPVRHLHINQVSNSEDVPVSTLKRLFRGQRKGSDDLYYNKGDGSTGSATVGNGYYMTPNADKAEVWAGEGINPISIEANTKDILTKNELVEKTKWANELINDEAYMADLWDKDPDMADFIENLSMGRLPEVSKYLDKPFIQPDSGQGEELAETIFFPDTRPELTQSIRNSLKEKSSKVRQSDVGLSPQQQEFFKDSVVRDENGELMPMYHGTRGDFTVFGEKNPSSSSNSKSGVGFWFTPTEEGAKNFASSIWYGDGEPKAMKTYLNMKNPKVYESVDNSKAVESLRKKLDEIELKSKTMSKPKLYYKNMYDYSVAYNMVNQGDKDMAIKWLAGKSNYDDKTATELIEEIDNMKMLEDEKKRIQDEISELKYGDAYERFRTDIYKVDGQTAEDANVGGIGMALRDDSSVQKYVDNLKSEGYDGIIIKGTNYDSDTMGGANDQYVVFDPEQIKNVDNKRPTKNKDIRYAIAAALGIGSIIGPYMNSQKSVDNIK